LAWKSANSSLATAPTSRVCFTGCCTLILNFALAISNCGFTSERGGGIEGACVKALVTKTRRPESRPTTRGRPGREIARIIRALRGLKEPLICREENRTVVSAPNRKALCLIATSSSYSSSRFTGYHGRRPPHHSNHASTLSWLSAFARHDHLGPHPQDHQHLDRIRSCGRQRALNIEGASVKVLVAKTVQGAQTFLICRHMFLT